MAVKPPAALAKVAAPAPVKTKLPKKVRPVTATTVKTAAPKASAVTKAKLAQIAAKVAPKAVAKKIPKAK